MHWERYSREEIKQRFARAIDHNINYHTDAVLGFPGTHLDAEDYYADDCSVLTRIPWTSPSLDDEPYLRAIIENPNHIGCHTAEVSEHGFPGTQELEREAIALCAEEIMRAPKGHYDGYIAPGGTECNLQACWILRNLFRRSHHAGAGQIGLVFSADTHYSVWKAANLLDLSPYPVPVNDVTRQMEPAAIAATLNAAVAAGVRCVIGVVNMGTTMFGSVDDPAPLVAALQERNLAFRLHADGAYGGFIYPFTVEDHHLDFRNLHIASITMDAHKMLKAPYGTGVFLCRKGLIDEVCTDEASYVLGKDYTICGSRSGANAVAVWMLLRDAGSAGLSARCRRLRERTDRLCARLTALGVTYFRHPAMNQVALRSAHITPALAKRYLLVPDTHDGAPRWWKIVVMDHVRESLLEHFLSSLEKGVQ
jgi:tyrosine decarboxylase / aspartate 1-decarboxylase